MNTTKQLRKNLQRLMIICLVLAAGGRAMALDPGRIMADIRTQCAFGPRVPGTPEHERCRDWIKSEGEAADRSVLFQSFEAELAVINRKTTAWNIWLTTTAMDEIPADGPALIMISAHWDTRPVADNDPAGSRGTFLGANDGASGVALALELARALKGTPLAERIIIAFWDAEDSGTQGNNETWCLGARHAAKHPPAWFGRVKLGINLDMIGGKGMRLSRELTSQKAAPAAMNRLWRTGDALAPHIFINETIGPMIDDHVPFIEAGTPYIDLIGLPYEHWHRSGDLPEACDGEVMRSTGEVLLNFVRREAALMDAGKQGG